MHAAVAAVLRAPYFFVAMTHRHQYAIGRPDSIKVEMTDHAAVDVLPQPVATLLFGALIEIQNFAPSMVVANPAEFQELSQRELGHAALLLANAGVLRHSDRSHDRPPLLVLRDSHGGGSLAHQMS